MHWIIAHGKTNFSASVWFSVIIEESPLFRTWVVKGNKKMNEEKGQYAQKKRVKSLIFSGEREIKNKNKKQLVSKMFLLSSRLNLTSRNCPSRLPSSPATPSPRCTAPCTTGKPPLLRGSSSFRSPLEHTSPTSPCKNRSLGKQK